MKKLLRQFLLTASVLSAPLIVLLLDLPADVFAGCGGYGYSCQQPVCFGLEVTTDSGSTWKDGSVTIYGAPGTQVSVTVRTVLSVSSGNSVQGWSFSVRPDASPLLNAGGNFAQTAAEESSLSYINCGSPPDFEDTRLRPCGYTQGVLVDTGGSGCDLTGPVLIVTSEACFDVTFPSTQGIFPVTLAFTDDIGDPPVQSIAVRAGESEIPCKFDLTLNLYSTTSYYPTPSYCPLTPQTPLACGGGGSGGGAGAALPGRDFLRGDANQDGLFNLSDPVSALSFLFLGDSGPGACRDAVDSNDDGALNLADPVYSLNHLFLGGPALPNPGPTQCGPDLTADNLDCLSFNEVECPWTDSDCDGLSDAFEVIIGTEPGDPNCNCFDEGEDEDGIPEVDCDGDGLADVDPGSGALLTPFGWDTDGDGFSDGQECLPSGVPGLNGASLNIAELGANPRKPDVFVEVDRMAPVAGHDHVVPSESLSALRDMFANADVFEGEGIALHIDAGPQSVMYVDEFTGAEVAWGALSHANEIPHEDLALPAGANDVAIRDAAIESEAINFDRDARGRVFHYCLSAHWGGNAPVHGKAEWGLTGGDTFAVTTALGSPIMSLDAYTRTFAHELGHVLGLYHAPYFVPGDRNGFSYYHSIMERGTGYPEACATNCVGFVGDNVMDYSGEVLGPFDEQAVDEQRGVCVVDGICVGGNCQAFDFDFSGSCSAQTYPRDLNRDGDMTDAAVVGRNDWKTLFHHNNSRAERLLEIGLSSSTWSSCEEVLQP